MPRLHSGSALVTEVRPGGFRRVADSDWSREDVDDEHSYPGARYSGLTEIHGRPHHVWKVADQYFAQTANENPPNPLEWLATAETSSGSWWPHYSDWLAARSGQDRKSRPRLGRKGFEVLTAAPGTYVHDR